MKITANYKERESTTTELEYIFKDDFIKECLNLYSSVAISNRHYLLEFNLTSDGYGEYLDLFRDFEKEIIDLEWKNIPIKSYNLIKGFIKGIGHINCKMIPS